MTRKVLDSNHTGTRPVQPDGVVIMKKDQRVGYVRVSTIDQNTERQLEGQDVDRTFTDKASGKDTKRPQLDAALKYLREGDTLVVHSMDRLARNVEDLLRLVRELTNRGVSVEFVKNNMIFSGESGAMSKLMLGILGSVAEFERELLKERQREGIAIAKTKGVYKGRKKALTDKQADEARRLAASGTPKAELAKKYGVTRQTIYQYLVA